MATYFVDFQSQGTETDPTIPGKSSITLPKQTVNTSSTSLSLTGQGVPLYGEYQQENFIRLLENFASKIAPPNPTIGQIWFDSAHNVLKVYDINETWVEIGRGAYLQSSVPTSALEGQLWYHTVENILYLKIDAYGPFANTYPRYYGSWVQVWPHVVSYAGRVEYDALAARINKVIGAPQTDGSNSDIAENQWGWGETDTLSIFTDANTPRAFDNTAWTILLARLMKATLHVDQSTAPVSSITQYGFIHDGRGEHATATSYVPMTSWIHGWGGAGIHSLMTRYTDLLTAVTALENNRFSVNTSDTTWNVLDITPRPTWMQTKVYDATIQFTSEANAKAFFNSGGQLRFNISNIGGYTALNNAWNNLWTNNGTDVDDYTTGGFVIDYKGCKLGSDGAYIGGASSKGYYDLTTSFQTLHSVSRGGAYGAGSMVFEAKRSTTGGWAVDVRITFEEDYTSGNPKIEGTTSVAIQVRRPTGAVSGNPTITTPAIVLPTATTSGTFKTAPAE